MEEDKQNMLKTISTFQTELTAKHNKFKVTNSKSFTILPGIVESRASSEIGSSEMGKSVRCLETLTSEAELKGDVIEKWGFDHLVLNMTEADDEIYNALSLTVGETSLSQVRNLEEDRWRGAKA